VHASRPLVWLLLLAAAAGCSSRPPAGGPARISVAATFYPLAEFAQRVGGDRVEVRVLVPPGVEPHEYEPTPRDLAALARARVFLYNGAGLEPWVSRTLPGLPRGGVVVNATEGLRLRASPGSPAAVDPHVWLDPVLAQAQVDRIRDGLTRADPAGAAAYAAGARALREELGRLHRRYAEVLGACRRKEFVTSHAAFGYLAARYGLVAMPIAGVTPETEPSPARLRALVAEVRRSGTRVIFAETLASRRVVDALARETGAQVRVLNPLEGLTPQERARGLNYLVVMDENLRQLADGLDCPR